MKGGRKRDPPFSSAFFLSGLDLVVGEGGGGVGVGARGWRGARLPRGQQIVGPSEAPAQGLVEGVQRLGSGPSD